MSNSLMIGDYEAWAIVYVCVTRSASTADDRRRLFGADERRQCSGHQRS